ncbi:MAG: excinuclease ABC subunit UvrC [Candidatus Omnitrophica bacterium]|nr:excinuclease ABC subunit UvrC [Candidatus Omnitrophota bacterium]
MDLQKFVRTLPETPGVYFMKDAQGKIMYVGKAINIRKRVASYFQFAEGTDSARRTREPKTRILVRQIASIEFVQTATEAEALLVEASCIKEWKPKYNIELRDDKSYPLIKVTIQEEFPRIFVGRGEPEPGVKVIGPFTNAALLRQALSAIRRIFPFRTCRALPKRACLDYYIGLCPAPCIKKIEREQYLQMLEKVFKILEGQKTQVLEELTVQMKEDSKAQRYEDAARLRDQIAALTELSTRPRRFLPSDALDDLRRLLNLPALPRQIEGFDISNIHGRQAVGSMVTFRDGKADRSSYKKFQIKTVSQIDDYAMMREVVRRRFLQDWPRPDLVLIDGGRGHAAAAKEVLDELKINLPVVGLAKEFEQLFLPGRSEPILLPPTSKALHVLQRVRDEAHRFAIGYHRRLRGKKALRSALDEIPGVGPRRRRDLLVQFGSVDAIQNASVEELSAIRGISTNTAERILRCLTPKGGAEGGRS